MKYIKTFSVFEGISVTDINMPIINRTKSVSEEEFLVLLRKNCKNFSFANDLLWRNKRKKGDLELFTPEYRNAKAISFPNFFDKIENDPDYPVVRKKSLIGGTNKDIIKRLVGYENYLVIPFDDSEIVFVPTIDMLAMDDDRMKIMKSSELINNEPISDKHFVKVSYTKGFEIPSSELETIRSSYNIKFGKYGDYEFFTSSPCLLVHEDKVNWLRNQL